jgi:hypothetical protein
MMGELNEAHQPKYLTRTPLPAVDWGTFFDAVNTAMDLHLQTYGPPGQKAPTLVSEVPKTNEGNFDTSFDVILYKIMESKRAASDPSGRRRIPKGPTVREVKPHPTKARYHIVTVGWWELMKARFTIYALSADRASEVTEWFHRMMMRYTFDLSFFKARGVQYMTFDGRGEDEFSRLFGQELYIRNLDYNVRLELLESFEVKDIESLNIKIGGPPNPQTELDLDEQYITPKP